MDRIVTKDNVHQNPDVSSEDAVRNKLIEIADNLDVLEKSVSPIKEENEKSYSNKFQGENQKLIDSNNVVKTSVHTDLFQEVSLPSSPTDDDVSSFCNSQTSITPVKILDSYSNITTSHLNISEEDKDKNVTEVSFLTSEDRKRTCPSLKVSNDVKEAFKDTFRDNNLNVVEHLSSESDAESSDSTFNFADNNLKAVEQLSSESYAESSDSTFNFANIESDISHPDLEFSDSDPESKHDKMSPNAKNIPYEQFPDSMNSDNEFEHIEALLTSDDPGKALENYLSGRNCNPFKASGISDNNAEISYINFRPSDSEPQVSLSDVSILDSVLESEPEKLSPKALQILKQLQQLKKGTTEFQTSDQKPVKSVESFSNSKVSAENSPEISASSQKTMASEESTDSMTTDDVDNDLEELINLGRGFPMMTDDEFCIAEALSNSDDPEAALKKYFCDLSLPTTTLKLSKDCRISGNDIDIVYLDTADDKPQANFRILKFSDGDLESKPVKLSVEGTNLIKSLHNLTKNTDSYDIVQDQVNTVKKFPDLKLSSRDDREASVFSHETIKNTMYADSLATDDEDSDLEELINKGRGFSLKDVFDENPIASGALEVLRSDSMTFQDNLNISDSNSETSHSDSLSSDSNEEWLHKRSLNSLKEFQHEAIENSMYSDSKTTDEDVDNALEDLINLDGGSSLKPFSEYDLLESKVFDILLDDSKTFNAGSNISNCVLETSNSDSKASDSDKELRHKRSGKILNSLNEFQNEIGREWQFQGLFQEINNRVRNVKGELDFGDDKIPVFSSRKINKNEVSTHSVNNNDACDPPKAEMLVSEHITDVDEFCSGRNQSRNAALKFPSVSESNNSGQLSSNFKQSNPLDDDEALQLLRKERKKRKNSEISMGDLKSDDYRDIFKCTVETRDNYPDELVDVFMRVIKCHPIQKFEIPPYESTNTKTASVKTGGKSWTTHAWDCMQLYSKNEHGSILECFCDIDSDSVMVVDVTDSFCQNSRIICDTLVKEYMNISAKIDLMLIKKIEGISIEEYELRMSSLLALDDDLGFIIAKLITIQNDWVKQFKEIAENIAETRSVSRDLNHLGLLKICMSFVQILIKLCLEKELELEDYEKNMIFTF